MLGLTPGRAGDRPSRALPSVRSARGIDSMRENPGLAGRRAGGGNLRAGREGEDVMPQELTPVRVWDLPTRVFHWIVAVAVIGSIVSAKIGGNALVWHMRLGYLIFTLLVFRLLWGLVGGRWSRFASFVYAPGAVLRYLRGQSRADEHHDVGHSPLAAFSVFALIALLCAQVGTGLFADDEIATTGPLNKFVASATGLALTRWHKGWGQWLIITLVLLHIGAVVFYLARHRRNLIRPMWSGDKTLPGHVPASADGSAARVLALVLVALCGGGVAWLVSSGG
jgi:cytochrome b